MILDERNEFADAVAVAGAAGTRLIGDVIDLEVVRDIGQGHPIYFYVSIDTAPTGADTVAFRLVSDAQEAIAVDGTETVHFDSGPIAIADLPDGAMAVMVAVPAEGNAYERFLGFQVVNVGASSLADLLVSAGLTLDNRGNKHYPEGQN